MKCTENTKFTKRANRIGNARQQKNRLFGGIPYCRHRAAVAGAKSCGFWFDRSPQATARQPRIA